MPFKLKTIESWFSALILSCGDENMQEGWISSQKEFRKLFKKKVENKPKIPKDPEAPKKNVSGYILFSNKYRDDVKKECPNLAHKEIMGELGKRWKSLSSSKQDKYKKLAEEDKKRYENEMKNYVQDQKYSKKKIKDPNAVKGPISSYLFFCKDERKVIKETTDLKGKEIATELGLRWKELKEEKSSRVEMYNKLAKEDRERYKLGSSPTTLAIPI